MTTEATTGRPLHCGVAGWSYADWRDTVYRLPPKKVQPDLFGDLGVTVKPQHAKDELVFIADYVDMVEINSSFYRVPTAKMASSWVRRIGDRSSFFFTAKLNQDFTHRQLRDTSLAKSFRDGLRPLADRGILRGLLAQFRYDFADTSANRDQLLWIRDKFAEFADLVVEVRHISWQDPAALQFLVGLGATVANLDYPTASDSFTLQGSAGGDKAYLRLHGRNREAWFSRDASVEETYNYDYSEDEISGLAQRSRDLLKEAKELTIVANNHYQGKAVSAALRLKAALTDQNVPVPPGLLESYPHLKRIAETLK